MKNQPVHHTSDLSDAAVICRAFEHEWHWVNDTNITTGTRGRVVEFRRERKCGTCGALQKIWIETQYFSRKSYTDYPDGYLMKGGRLLKADARRELMQRETRARRRIR